MMTLPRVRVRLCAAALLALFGCGGPRTGVAAKNAPPPVTGEKFQNALRCDATKPGYELSYHDVSGHGKPDMVEVIAFSKTPAGTSEGRVVCMEVDTNHDGNLDVLRVFSDKGELESEEADRNYDGKADVWITYEKGAVSKTVYDSKYSGKADEFHYYKDGKLKRIERDRNSDGKPDVWEFYVNGRLERMGIDTDYNGKVDVWYRDEIARAEQKKVSGGAGVPTAASAAPSASAPAPTSSK